MKKLFFIFFIFFCLIGQTQITKRGKELPIYYEIKVEYRNKAVIKVRRLPPFEFKKINAIDVNLLASILNVENNLKQRSAGVKTASEYKDTSDIHSYFVNLRMVAKSNRLTVSEIDYRAELNYLLENPVKTPEEIKNEKLQIIYDQKKEQQRRNDEFDAYNTRRECENDSIERLEYKKLKERDSLYVISEALRQKEQEKQQKEAAKIYKQKQADNKLKSEDEKKSRQVELIRRYGAKNAELINKHIVVIGWNESMCIESWGKPQSKRKTTTSNGTSEQWVYNIHKYLYFDNGVLTATQE